MDVPFYLHILRDGGMSELDPRFPDAEQLAIEDWIAEGCPPLDGVTVSERDRELLLAQPLTIRQAALREQCAERTVQRWLAKGELPGASKVGRNWRIPAGDLDARRVRSTQPKPKATVHKRRARKRAATTGGTSWLR